jgi:hypothetical protein
MRNVEEKQIVPDQHSDLVGGSTAARRLNCPASYALEQRVPKDKGSVYANEGTALHEMMTKLLLDPELAPEDILPFTFTHKDGWTMTIEEKTWYDLGQPALDAFLDYMDGMERETGGEFEYLVEQQCAFPGIAGAFGTSDIVWRCGDVAGIWDWKFGYGAVKAEENAQLMFYAQAARFTNPEFFKGITKLELAIMQPARSEEPDVWETTTARLGMFQTALVDAVREVKARGAEARMAKGDHCKFARCMAVCPLHVNPAVALAAKLGLRKDDEKAAAAEGEPLADGEAFEGELSFIEMLPDLLELAEIAEDYAKEVFARAANLAINDPEVRDQLRPHGWGLKDGRAGNLSWVVEDKKVMGALRRRGLKKKDFVEEKLISPTQAEKKLKALGVELPPKLAERPPSKGPAFTRLYPDTKEYQSAADKARQLGERLAKIG